MIANNEIVTFHNISERCGYIKHFGGNCVHPYHKYDKQKIPTPGTQLVVHPGCDDEQYYFCVTPQGEIRHKRSELCVQMMIGGMEAHFNHLPLTLNECGKNWTIFRLTPGRYM